MKMGELFKIIVEWLRKFFSHEEQPSIIESGQDEQETAQLPPQDEEECETNMENNEHKITILLDNGHAKETCGKRSPKFEDGTQFFEYEFNRDVVRRIVEKLDKIGIKYEILVPEVEYDVPLSKRAERANSFCEKYGVGNCLFISVHANAAGNGEKWMTAKGWSCYTSKGETTSDKYAEIFMVEAEKALKPAGFTIRKYSAKKYSWEENYTVLVKTKCPAVLSENLFYDNKVEAKFLMTDEGRDLIAQIHVNAILEIEKLAK